MALNCLECGACCRYIDLNIERLDNDTKKWLGYHEGIEVLDNGQHHTVRIMAKCRHLRAGNSCGIYANRPLTCKLFKVGGEGCQKARELLKISEEKA